MARELAAVALVFIVINASIYAKAAEPAKPASSSAADAPADKIGSLDDYIGNASDDDAAPGPISAKPDKYVAPTNDAPPVPPPSPGTNHTSGAQSGSKDGAYYAVKASTLVAVAGVVSCFF
ncbi:hypothetical protein MRB53_006107 [Persea americana]|uniref:Uncharacterized protein n=1 Tax=Persea americana TaxID=3435 RepID=A0ACC2MFF7_PERAE|nr:hypothetical protein MRB53_006107 [Persea americana]